MCVYIQKLKLINQVADRPRLGAFDFPWKQDEADA